MKARVITRPLLSTRAGRLSLWLGGAALALLIFVRITRELIEGDPVRRGLSNVHSVDGFARKVIGLFKVEYLARL